MHATFRLIVDPVQELELDDWLAQEWVGQSSKRRSPCATQAEFECMTNDLMTPFEVALSDGVAAFLFEAAFRTWRVERL